MHSSSRREVLRSLASICTATLAWQRGLSTEAAPAFPIPSDEEVRALLRKRIDQERQSRGIVVGLVGAHPARFIGNGTTSAQDPRTPDADALFLIGSISKLFTAVLVGTAVARGELRYDDPAIRYLPPGTILPTFEGRQITLRDLLTHTSGLPTVPDDFPPESDLAAQAHYDRRQLYAFLMRYRLSVAPGTRWLYSNLSANIAADALEHRLKKDFPTLLLERVLRPLDLSSTYINLDTAPRSRLVPGHDVTLRELPYEPVQRLFGHGNMYSSARDMTTFVAAYMGVRRTPLRAAMAATLSAHRPIGVYPGEQAMGPQMFGDTARPLYGHSGSTSGHASAVLWSPAQLGVVVLSNAAPPVSDIAGHLLDPRVPLALPMRSTAVDPALLRRYMGRYDAGSGLIMVITLEGSNLVFEAPGFSPKIQIVPESEGSFNVPRIGARLAFEGAAPAPPLTLTVELAGSRYTGRRILE